MQARTPGKVYRHVDFFSLAKAWWVYRQAGRSRADDARASRPRTPQSHVNNFGCTTLQPLEELIALPGRPLGAYSENVV